jgi:putative ABC transport system ATP-binding protein
MTEHERTLFRRRHIGFVYQAFNLLPTLTVADNVRLVLELNKVTETESAARIDELLTAVDLRDRADSYPDVLSGGEQQRVAIARALCHRPPLLLADEPTGNLDDKTAGRVMVLLDALLRKTGGTLIVATHSSTVASFCDRVLELHDGTLTLQREHRARS